MTHDGDVAETHVEAVYRPSTVGNAAEAPPLSKDGAFYGYLTCQFLGAFNDNLFKQLILLLAVQRLRPWRLLLTRKPSRRICRASRRCYLEFLS